MIRHLAPCSLMMLVLGLSSGVAHAQHDSAETESEEMPLILLISKDVIDDLTRDQVEMSVPIDRQIEGSRVTGLAKGQGVVQIQLAHSDTNAEFSVAVTGEVRASFQATMGPVTGVASTQAPYQSSKRFRFDGEEFSSVPATTTSRNRTSIDQICSQRRGLIGRAVRSIASRMIMRYKHDVDLAVQQVTQDMISSYFDEAGDDLVDRLNSMTEFEETVMQFFPDTESWQFQLRTTDEFLFAGFGPPDATVPQPFLQRDDDKRASMEVWVRTTRVQGRLLKVVVEEWEVAHDLLRQFLPEDDAEALLEDVNVSLEDGWSVIEVGKRAGS